MIASRRVPLTGAVPSAGCRSRAVSSSVFSRTRRPPSPTASASWSVPFPTPTLLSVSSAVLFHVFRMPTGTSWLSFHWRTILTSSVTTRTTSGSAVSTSFSAASASWTTSMRSGSWSAAISTETHLQNSKHWQQNSLLELSTMRYSTRIKKSIGYREGWKENDFVTKTKPRVRVRTQKNQRWANPSGGFPSK